MLMTLQDIYEKWYSTFDDNYDGSFFISYLYEQSDILERLSVINVLGQINTGSLACLNKENLLFDFDDYLTNRNNDGITLNRIIKTSLLTNVSSAYGWEPIAVEQSYEPFHILGQMLLEGPDYFYGKQYDHIKEEGNFDNLYLLTSKQEYFNRCSKNFLKFARNKLKENMEALPCNLIKKLIFTDDISYATSYTILKIKRIADISEDFFDAIHQSNRYCWLPFVCLYQYSGYYYLVIRSYWVDDTDCRISDIVDLRFLDLNAFSELFNTFDSINS